MFLKQIRLSHRTMGFADVFLIVFNLTKKNLFSCQLLNTPKKSRVNL